MKYPTVIEMVKAYLKEHGYDGLYCVEGDPCGCRLDDLAPCGEMSAECRAGDEYPCDCGNRCAWHIGIKVPEEEQ